MSHTKVTDAGLKELAPLKNLTTLFLIDTPVTDEGLKELAPLKNLTKLYLDDTKVTDAGLKELVPLKNLTTLDLTSTKVTDAGLKELRDALPKCKISPPGLRWTEPGLTFQVRPKPREADSRIPQTPFSAGLPVALFDGSVRTNRAGVAPEVFWGLVTPAGGEVVSLD